MLVDAYALVGTSDNVTLSNGKVYNNTAGSAYNIASGTNNRVQNITGYNPVGAGGIAAGAAHRHGLLHRGDDAGKRFYIAVSTSITFQGRKAASAFCRRQPAIKVRTTIQLGPNESAVVSYTGTLGGEKRCSALK